MATSGKGYSALQLGLHWLIAVLVLYQLIFGEVMGDYVDHLAEGEPVDAATLSGGNLHLYVGIAILVLALLRLVIRLTAGVPAPVPGPTLQVKAGEALHWAFYVLLFAVPVTGLIAFYGQSETFGGIHEIAKPVFIVFIILHAGAALYHHFILKDSTLRRMMVPGSM